LRNYKVNTQFHLNLLSTNSNLRRYTAEPPRLSLSLAPRAVTSSSPLADAPLLASLFTDVDAADALADARAADADDAAGAAGADTVLSAETAAALAPGADIAGVVHGVREYGVLVDMLDVVGLDKLNAVA
jgi:rRNA biogenesis protein RRP5